MPWYANQVLCIRLYIVDHSGPNRRTSPSSEQRERSPVCTSRCRCLISQTWSAPRRSHCPGACVLFSGFFSAGSSSSFENLHALLSTPHAVSQIRRLAFLFFLLHQLYVPTAVPIPDKCLTRQSILGCFAGLRTVLADQA